MNRLRPYPLPANTLRDILGSDLDALPDAELLDRFARYADHLAFEALIRRHGPTVLGVCRRTLGNAPDADDAFQATFLVFLRKCRSIRGDRLGPWLYGVAWRVSQKARVRAARLAGLRGADPDTLADPRPPAETPDWLPVLDAELHALPRKYREALILCELQGATRAHAARTLGLREGTLSSRLARGRDLLRRRLLKHGTLLPAGGLLTLFEAGGIGHASVPAALIAKTAGLVTGTAPVVPAQLTDEVLNSMMLKKLRAAGLVLAFLAAGAVGLATSARPSDAPGPRDRSEAPSKATGDAPKVAGVPQEGKPRPPVGPDRDTVQGYWKLDKYDISAKLKANAEVAKSFEQLVPHTCLLVEGDVWWIITANHATRHDARLTPERNPKWIDSPPLKVGEVTREGMRGIYRLPDADTLEVCWGEGTNTVRPAEFVADDEHDTSVLRFRRAVLPAVTPEQRAARAPLLGEWVRFGPKLTPVEQQPTTFTAHFAFLPMSIGTWHTYRYELDTAKDPGWIDLPPVALDVPKDAQPPVIHGAFAVHPDGQRASLALGIGVKRVARPLEFVESAQNKVEVWTLARPRAEVSGPAPAPLAK